MSRKVQHRLENFRSDFFPIACQRFKQMPPGRRLISCRRFIDVTPKPGRISVVEWMDCRTDIVDKAGQRQLGRARSAADGLVCFQYERRPTRARQCDCGGEPVRTRPDHDGVVFGLHKFNLAEIRSRWRGRRFLDPLHHGGCADQDQRGDDLMGTQCGVKKSPGDANGGECLHHFKITCS